MDAKNLQRLLRKLHACDGARLWAEDKSLAEAWEQCERGDWLLWLCGYMADKKGWPTRQQVVLAACDCAETALRYVKAGEDRPRKAIETARQWAEGTATTEQVRAAADSAYAAAVAVDSAYAAAAAAVAVNSDYAASFAAAYAAYAASSAAARTKAIKHCADLVRKRIPVPLQVEVKC